MMKMVVVVLMARSYWTGGQIVRHAVISDGSDKGDRGGDADVVVDIVDDADDGNDDVVVDVVVDDADVVIEAGGGVGGRRRDQRFDEKCRGVGSVIVIVYVVVVDTVFVGVDVVVFVVVGSRATTASASAA